MDLATAKNRYVKEADSGRAEKDNVKVRLFSHCCWVSQIENTLCRVGKCWGDKVVRSYLILLERETRFELATLSLGS